ncbi:hypothetical protein D3C78_308570 [compost metagenome]
MNIFASLEDVLSPVGESKTPVVGLLVQDWDENLKGVAEQVVDLGYGVQLIPTGGKAAMEDLPNGIVTPDPIIPGHQPQVLFYYKGKPEDASEELPVLVVDSGKVQVTLEGRVKELAEYLGLLEDADNDPRDHEYR